MAPDPTNRELEIILHNLDEKIDGLAIGVSKARHDVANLQTQQIAMTTRLDTGIVPYMTQTREEVQEIRILRRQEAQARESDRKTLRYILIGQALGFIAMVGSAVMVALLVGGS